MQYNLTKNLYSAFLTTRLAILVIFLYIFREPILDFVGKIFDVYNITVMAIQIVGTPVSRVVLAVVTFLILSVIAYVTRKWLPGRRFWTLVSAGAFMAAIVFLVPNPTRSGMAFLILSIVILVLNLIADILPNTASNLSNWIDRVVRWIPGSGLLFSTVYAQEVGASLGGRPQHKIAEIFAHPLYRYMPVFAIFSVVVAATTMTSLMPMAEQVFRLDKGVTVIARSDFHELALSNDKRYLFATGHGQPYILRYDLNDLSRPPVPSSDQTHLAQSLSYQSDTNDVAVSDNNVVKIFDADTMQLRRQIPLGLHMASGDPRISIDTLSGTITVVSEADKPDGPAMVVLDKATGKILAQDSIDAGNILSNPAKPLLYMSFFQRGSAILAYDLNTHKVTKRFPISYRADRMALDVRSNELLICLPVQGQILRLDADTLEKKGAYKVMNGVRAIAIDESRNVLMAGSLLTGTVALYDITSGKKLRTWYLAPWVRFISFDEAKGEAYVSSNGGLFKFNYVDGLKTK